MKVLKLRRKPDVVRVPPNSVDCLHQGALAFGGTCFATDSALAHVECASSPAQNTL